MSVMFDQPDSGVGVDPAAVDQETLGRHERQILERLGHIPGVLRPAPADGGAWRQPPLRTLAARLRMRPQLSTAEQIEIAGQLTATLAAVHRAGVTHGDLNVGNVVLEGHPVRPVITGFGHATTVAERDPAFSHHNSIHSHLATIAPEQTGRTGYPVDQRADLYGLGVTLYQMVAEAPPFALAE